MAIEGPLRELGLPDLLQLVHLSRKTGTLTVRADRAGRASELEFDRGAVVGVRAGGQAARLGQLLLMAGKVTQGQLDRALREQQASPERRLGAVLFQGHGVPRHEVERQLRFQVEETVFDLVRWTEGYFRFEEEEIRDPGPIGLRISTEGLLMESLRRMDEWSAMASAAPDTDLVPSLVDGSSGGGETGQLALQPADWEVLAAVDGDRTLRSIARLLGQAEFEVAKAVFSLVGAGVVELTHRRAALEARSARPASNRSEAEVETHLREGRVDEAERRLEELLHGAPERAELHALRAKVDSLRGDWRAAVERLERAVRHDPLLGSAYYDLGMAALRLGELARAGDALGTYLRLPDTATRNRERAREATSLIARLEGLLEEEEGD